MFLYLVGGGVGLRREQRLGTPRGPSTAFYASIKMRYINIFAGVLPALRGMLLINILQSHVRFGTGEHVSV